MPNITTNHAITYTKKVTANQQTYSHHIFSAVQSIIKLGHYCAEIRIGLQLFQALIEQIIHFRSAANTSIPQYVNHLLNKDFWVESSSVIFQGTGDVANQSVGQTVEPLGLQ